MIQVRGIKKRLNGGRGSFVLNDANIDIPPKKIVAILGTNGAGKSTLLKLLSGVILPDGGTVSLHEGEDTGIHTLATHTHLRALYLDQNSERDLVPSMTIAENMYLAQIPGAVGSLRFPSRRSIHSMTEKAVASISLGLEMRMNEQVRVLSGGEKQGIVLARAFLSGSRWLLLDEFVSAMARDVAKRMMCHVRNITQEMGNYCVFVTHEADLAFEFADEFVFMHEGKVVANFKENSAKVHKEILLLYSRCFREYIHNEQ